MKKDIPRDQATGPLLTFKWVRIEKNGMPNYSGFENASKQSDLWCQCERGIASSSSCEKIEERRNIYRQKNPFNDLISVCREDSVCCAVASLLNFAMFNLIVVINKHSLKVFSHTATLKSLHCMSFWSVNM